MADTEVLAWTKTKTEFDAAYGHLYTLLANAQTTLNTLRQNWRDVWPKGKAFTANYTPGKSEFDPVAWPDGSRIMNVLDECHRANQAQILAYSRLTQQERQTLNIFHEPR